MGAGSLFLQGKLGEGDGEGPYVACLAFPLAQASSQEGCCGGQRLWAGPG